jgi:hypothetical protein
VLEPEHGVVGITHDEDIPARLLLPPRLNPEIQDLMQVEVGQHGRDDAPGGLPPSSRFTALAPSPPPSATLGSGG